MPPLTLLIESEMTPTLGQRAACVDAAERGEDRVGRVEPRSVRERAGRDQAFD